jgi:hypothetical protein
MVQPICKITPPLYKIINGEVIHRPEGPLLNGIKKLISDICENKNDITLLEIGCFSGESAILWLPHCKKYYGIDPWAWNNEEYMYYFYKRTENYKDKITIYRDFSYNVHGKIENNSLDIIYLDGDHSYEIFKKDVELYLPKLKNGGYLCGHDYTDECDGIIKYIYEKFEKPDGLYEDGSWMIRKI